MSADAARQNSRSAHARRLYMQRHGLLPRDEDEQVYGPEPITTPPPVHIVPPVAARIPDRSLPHTAPESEASSTAQASTMVHVPYVPSKRRVSGSDNGGSGPRWSRGSSNDHQLHVYMQRHGLFKKPDESIDDLTVDGHARTDEKYSSRFSSMRNIVDKEKYAEDDDDDSEKKKKTKEKKESVPKVSFFALYRFHTRTEIIINILGFIPAAATGAAQPLMSLIFGRLTQDFVDFANALGLLTDPTAILKAAALLPRLAENFRRSSAVNASYMVYMGLGTLVATTLFMTAWVYTSEMASKRLRERYLKAVLRQDVAFFDSVGAGEVTTRITTDTHLVQLAVSEKVALSVTYIAAFIAGFTLAFVRNWRLALAMSSVIPCIALTGGFLNHFIQYYLKLSLSHIAEGGTLAEEILGSVRTAQAFGTQKTLSNLYNSFVEKSRKVDSISAVFNGCGMAVFFFVIYAAYALAFSFGATLINGGYADAGTVVNVFLSVLIGSFSLALLAPEAQAIAAGQAAAAKLYATIDRVPPIDSQSTTGDKPTKVVGEIEVRGVSFEYPSRPDVPVLNNLSLHFPAGKTVALVGASGSGKSTIISLVERFYDPKSGSVTLDGIDLRELNVKWLRSQIGLVSQEPVLFATTIRDNVAYGLINTEFENATETEKMSLIISACKKANAHSFIKKMPLGYNTLVGERGFLMSGGQKQRIAIARAIVSDPRILLLDEATSALDTQSEGIVQDALDKASAGRTTICIAHRLSTIKDADCIYVMGEGKVLQRGTHSELLSDADGAYARLVQSQKLREDEDNHDVPFSPTKSEDYVASPIKSEYDEKEDHRLSILSYDGPQMQTVVKYSDGPEHSLTAVLGRMLKINKEDWMRYVLGLFFASLTGCIYPGFGIVFAKGIDAFSDLTPWDLHHDADRSALWLFIIAVCSILTTGVQTFMLNSAAANLGAKIRVLSFKALLRQDIAYFDRDDHATGSLTSSLSDNSQKISGMAGLTLGVVIQSIATVVSGLIIGLIFAWKLALVAISTLPLLLSSGYTRLRLVILKDQNSKKEHEASAQVACEAAGAIRTVASLTREDDCLRVYSQSLEIPLRRSNRMAIWTNLLFACSQCMAFFVIALVFWYGSRLVSFQEYTVFQFFAGIMATVFGATQAGGAFAFAPDISSARSAGSNVINLLDSVPEIDAESDSGKSVPLKKVEGTITFKDVEFEYPTRKDAKILKKLSFSVRPGTYVALVGASGCGKSTCIQLIERFYNPDKGTVHLDGYDIKSLNIQDYRKCLALVSQEPTLYAGTIRFNILLGAIKPAEEVTEQELIDVCQKANILDFIKSLPDGFDTQVGGKGSQLSGGQKQRIAIARALIRNPKVLLLDEATSALDSNSEKVVQVALDQARLGRTTIAIAHRLSTIQNADCIYFLKEGRICESGTHDELIRLRGEYYQYVQLQALSGK